MRKGFLLLIMLVCLCLVGCTPEQQEKADNIVAKVQVGVGAAQGVVNSPAGVMIPTRYRLPLSWAMAIAGAGISAWLNREKNRLKDEVFGYKHDLQWQESQTQKYQTATEELAYTIETFESMSGSGNEDMKTAKASALNPPTVKLLREVAV